MPRRAYKVFYDGRRFFGFQIQSGFRTVEGELFRALVKTHLVSPNRNEAKLASAGRTDRFVSALGNVFAVNVERDVPPCAINSSLDDDIRVWASAEVPNSFNPRRALRRHYRYFSFVGEEANLGLLSEASKLFEGIHDFRNFAYRSPSENSVRGLARISIDRLPDGIISISITGDSFLRRMVRKIVGVLIHVAYGYLELTEVERLLDPAKPVTKRGIPAASPNGLVLWDVEYEFAFKVDAYAGKKLRRSLVESVNEYAVRKRMYTEFRGYFNQVYSEGQK